MRKQVLNDEERQWAANYRLQNWLDGRDYRAKKQLYFATLKVFSGATVTRAGEVDGRVLMELLAVVFEADRSFKAWVEKKNRNSARLRTREGWREACRAAAGRVVQRYLAEEPDIEPEEGLVLTREDLRERLQELIAMARERGVEADALAGDQPVQGRYDPPTNAQPNLAAEALSRVESRLADEMLLFEDSGEELGVPESERDREVAKRALVRLRLTDLREIAAREDLPTDGTVEQVAQRIAEKHQDDEREIARLVIDHEEEAPERGFVTRLLPLHDEPNLEMAAARLRNAQGTYVRVDVARWLLVREVQATSGLVRITGTMRYYTVYPKFEYDKYGLSSKLREADTEILLRRGVRWVEISAKGGGDIRALAVMLDQAAGVQTLDALSLVLEVPEGPMLSWDRRTVFLLAFLGVELSNPEIRLLNTAMAQFEADPTRAAANPRQPAVRSIRINGQHLISSRQACEQIVAGRGLINLQIQIAAKLGWDEALVCPIRVELHADHATLYTGFTEVSEGVTRQIHDDLLRRLRGALESTDIAQSQAVRGLSGPIQARAGEENPEEADILPPPESLAAPVNGDQADQESGEG